MKNLQSFLVPILHISRVASRVYPKEEGVFLDEADTKPIALQMLRSSWSIFLIDLTEDIPSSLNMTTNLFIIDPFSTSLLGIPGILYLQPLAMHKSNERGNSA